MTIRPHILVISAYLLVSCLLLGAGSAPAFAASCLSSEQTRQAIAEGRAIHLSEIKQALSRIVRGEVIKAQLCADQSGLIYKITVLSRTGRVTRIQMDASTAKIRKGR